MPKFVGDLVDAGMPLRLQEEAEKRESAWVGQRGADFPESVFVLGRSISHFIKCEIREIKCCLK